MSATLHAALVDEYVVESSMRSMDDQSDFVKYRDCFYKNRLQSSGVAYARKNRTKRVETLRQLERKIRYGELQSLVRDDPKKIKARSRLINLFSYKVGPLRVLSMPGIMWSFERGLFRQRDALQQPTEIYTVEREAPIFQASVFKMPGKTRGIRQITPHAISTDRIACHYFTSVESFIVDARCPTFDAAWLDFTGFISFDLLAAIKHFWATRCQWRMAITSLNARFHPRKLSRTIEEAGGLQAWLTAEIGTPVDVHSYGDESSHMLQMVFEK